MPTVLTSYKWGTSQGLSLGNLSFVENDLYPQNKLHPIGIRSTPVDPYPIRDMTQAGYERGDGRIDVAWYLVCHVDVLEYILEVKFTSLNSSTYQGATINTRRHDNDDYARYSCYIIRPKPDEDWTYLRQKVIKLRLRFTGLVAL